MLLLPPSNLSAPKDRRVGDRRRADRRSAAAEPAVEPAQPVRQVRPRNGGRRKTDREPAPAVETPASSSASKPHAPLVAQLIAGALGVEQTRVRRRASLDDAVKLYGQRPDGPKPPRGEA